MSETKTLRKTVQGKIIQLDYDFITSLTGECSYCLTDAQVQMILAVLDYYSWSTRWFSDSGVIDQSVINGLTADLGARLMCGCCPDNSILSRWTADGHYQQSHNGGSTWEDATGQDPRNPVPQFPPFVPEGTTDESCTYADSIVQQLKTGIVDKLEDGNTFTQILEIIVGLMSTILVALAPTVLGSIIVAIATGLIAAIIGETIPLFQAAMTDAVYDRLRCNISSHIESDGSFTQADVDAIYAQVGTDETGIAAIFIQQLIAIMGVIGMTNAARAGFGSPGAVCCPTCDPTIWSIITYDSLPVGTLIGYGDNYIDIETASHPDFGGALFAIIHTPADSTCCTITNYARLSGGTIGAVTGVNCGDARWPDSSLHGFSMPADINTFSVNSDTATVVRVTFG